MRDMSQNSRPPGQAFDESHRQRAGLGQRPADIPSRPLQVVGEDKQMRARRSFGHISNSPRVILKRTEPVEISCFRTSDIIAPSHMQRHGPTTGHRLRQTLRRRGQLHFWRKLRPNKVLAVVEIAGALPIAIHAHRRGEPISRRIVMEVSLSKTGIGSAGGALKRAARAFRPWTRRKPCRSSSLTDATVPSVRNASST